MREVHTYRGFKISIAAQDDPAGGSTVSTEIERDDTAGRDDPRDALSAPRHARSELRDKAAIGEALDDARRAIDSALGEPDVLED